MMKLFVIILMLAACEVRAVIIPTTNTIAWSLAGVEGGIPTIANGVSVASYGAVGDGVTDDTSAFNSALAAAANDTAIQIPAGTYKITSSLTTSKRVVWRGAGLSTVIKSHSPGSGDNSTFRFDGSGTSANLFASNAVAGTSNLVLLSVSGLSAGAIVQVRQSNDTDIVYGNLEDTSGKLMQQWVRITAISGTNVTIDRPVWWEYKTTLGAYLSNAGSAVTNCGVENLKIDCYSNAVYAIRFIKCFNSWARGVVITNTGEHGIQFYLSGRCSAVSNELYAPIRDYSSRYGIQISDNSSEILVADNIIDGWSSGVLIQGSAGCVVGYNYCHRGFETTSPTDDTRFSFIVHGTFANYNLFEGNIGARLAVDDYWGVNHKNAFVRNWSRAQHLNETNGWTTASLVAVQVQRTNKWNSFVGNVLNYPGQSGISPWELGTSQWISTDAAETTALTLRHGNFNFVTNTVEWDSGVVDQSIPSSYYLDSKPAWFGSLSWPPIGPDVAASTNAITATNTYLIPAQARYYGAAYLNSRAFSTQIGGRGVTFGGRGVVVQ